MAEYINRESIMKFPIRKDHCDKEHANEHFINGIESVLEYAENLPAADVAPVVHGRWVRHTMIPYFVDCSVCKDVYVDEEWLRDGKWGYCPNCGAKMDGGDNAT